MSARVREHYDAHPDPNPETLPIGPGQLDRLDDNLHFGWCWHRYRYCYRRSDRLRILDAGCGTGLSSLALAALNPASTGLGVDFSGRSIELARRRTEAAGVRAVEFLEHDLTTPLPGSFGPFDFIVVRRMLGQLDEPGQVLANLAARLDARGLLMATFASQAGRSPARLFRRAIDALAEPGMDILDRARIGQSLFQALRPDHPIRRVESEAYGKETPGPERIISGYLSTDEHEWTLEQAIETVERAGLQFLTSPTRQSWLADRVFNKPAVSDQLKARVEGASERSRAVLMDALDPALHGEEYHVCACRADFEPRLPAWPEECPGHPEVLDRLIPHLTGLARPADLASDPATHRGCVSYRVVTGAIGELEWRSDAIMRAIDDVRTCGQIDQMLQNLTGVVEPAEDRVNRWLFLANRGFVLLESPDPKQNVDCRYLGQVRDRLDCPCPRKWVRLCERHGFCTIDKISETEPQKAALGAALGRLSLERVVSCAECPDYSPEERT